MRKKPKMSIEQALEVLKQGRDLAQRLALITDYELNRDDQALLAKFEQLYQRGLVSGLRSQVGLEEWEEALLVDALTRLPPDLE